MGLLRYLLATLVLISHRHGDHTDGIDKLADATGAPVWSVGSGFQRRFGGALTDGQVIGAAGLRIRVLATPGHTADSVSFVLDDAVLTADTVNHYVFSLQRPDWEVRFDMDKAAAAATRRKLLGWIATDRLPFIGYHMPFPGMGYLETRPDGFFMIPASYQLL